MSRESEVLNKDLSWTHNALRLQRVEPTHFQSRSTPVETCNPGSGGVSLCDRSSPNQTATRSVDTARLGAFEELWKLSAGFCDDYFSATDMKASESSGVLTHVLVGADGSLSSS